MLLFVRITLVLIVSFSLLPDANAATFGKNKVQYSYFEWSYLTTEHFDIYYTQDGRKIADFAADVAEQSYNILKPKLGYFPDDPSPIVLVTHQSHNDFEQTNISSSQPGEGTGGFTEFMKNRVVVPFQGDHEQFRHVIHHELTHAMMLNYLFGQGFGSVVNGLSQSRIPLWFVEGLAEYQSRNGLDMESELFIRDAVANDLLVETRMLDQLGYLGVYKCGQSVLYWIAWRYGDEKISDLLANIRRHHDFNRALKVTLGFNQEELSKRWRKFIREKYWTQIANLKSPDFKAKQLTDHRKEFCFINNSPAISPDGQWIAFLSDRSDYFDIYLMDAIDGKVKRRLVRGQRSGKFEELHWLRPGITWSPDGENIVFCAKAGEFDAMYVVNVSTGNIIDQHILDSDALFSPSWSPIDNSIALIRVHNGQSDIITLDLDTREIANITNDIYDEADPSWSPKGDKIIFTSNRNIDNSDNIPTTMFKHDFKQTDVYSIEVSSKILTRITNDDISERTPLWTANEDEILYVSDKSGIYNLYKHNIKTGKSNSITNMVTGCFQPSISADNHSITFSSYFNNGYDIYLMNDPMNEINHLTAWKVPALDKIPEGNRNNVVKGSGSGDYSHFVFNSIFQATEKDSTYAEEEKVEVRIKDENGKYPEKKYSVALTPDLVSISAGYSPYYKMQGSGMLLFTDVLGNHQLQLSLDLNRTSETSNIFFNYLYLARRNPYSIGFYHYAYSQYGVNTIWLDRTMSLFTSTSYPLNRFNRLDYGLNYLYIERKVLAERNGFNSEGSHKAAILPHLSFVHDTSVWHSYLEPANGDRWRVDALWSPKVLLPMRRGLQFLTLSFDWRKYINHRKDYTFAFRASGASSTGSNPQHFYLGGMTNWFNPWFDNNSGDVRVSEIEDIYFSSFINPLRGVGYYNRQGTRYLLSNTEFRFPFIRYLLMGWPLPAYFYNVRGATFFDIGTAWNKSQDQEINSLDWTYGYGFGIRLDLGIFPIEWDVAWSPDPSSNLKPRYYFSINAGF